VLKRERKKRREREKEKKREGGILMFIPQWFLDSFLKMRYSLTAAVSPF